MRNNAGSQEKYLERKLVEFIQSLTGEAVKGPSYMYKGIPDRIVILPKGGGTVWVEVKGGTYYQLQPMQEVWRDRLIDSAPDRYFLIDNKEDLEAFKEACKRFIDTANNAVI